MLERGRRVLPEATESPQPGELRRLLCPVDSPPLDHRAGDGPPQWLAAGDWRLLARPREAAPRGHELERFALGGGDRVSAVLDEERGRVWVPFDLDEAFRNYVSEAWADHVERRALTSHQLDLYYRIKPLVPRRVQLAARRLLVRRVNPPVFPSWPIEDGVLLLLRFYAYCSLVALDEERLAFRWFWPRGYRAAAILTHDVEGAAGLKLAPALADLEEERGLRSSFNIVAASYPIDRGIVRELTDRGFEIGVHGLRHDRSLFASRASFLSQLPAVAEAVRALEADGFRSPSTHRVYEWLGELPVRYDASMPHSDPFEPQPGGCCTLWPFRIGDVVELPYTMTQDHTLFTLLQARSVEPWLRQLDEIEARHGLVQCLSHPDPGYLGDANKRGLYVEFLDALVARDGIWRALPRAVASWWRRREAGDPNDPEITYGWMVRDEQSATLRPP
jgi:peptidoglycan/xylan/chitin deacetylase (PgdA/CDA1 family)